MQPREVTAILRTVIGGRGARAPDMHVCPAVAKAVRDAITNAGRAANDENGLSGEIEIGHGGVLSEGVAEGGVQPAHGSSPLTMSVLECHSP